MAVWTAWTLCPFVCLLHGPVPPPLPPYYSKATFSQPVDHFNAQLQNDTFDQLYLVNATWWGGEPSPIILYTGAEGNGIEAIFAHSGWVLALGRRLRALVVFAEMRFFGESVPSCRVRGQGYLSVEQAIADYAALVRFLRRAYGAHKSPVLALGGSLAGTLAFLTRLKYPADVNVALASSAPVLGYDGLCDPFGWYRVATATYERQAPGCPARVQRAFSALLSATPKELTVAFNTCSPADDATAHTLAAMVTDALAARAQDAYPPARSPVPATCARIKPELGPAALRSVLEHPGKCLNLTTPAPVDNGAREWLYLACTEIVHPISANNVTDMFPPLRWDLKGLEALCIREFGVRPRPRWVPESFGFGGGAADLGQVTSQIIFSNGLLDPWSAQSVTVNVSDTIVAINIADGAHHSDLGSSLNPAPSPGDSAALLAAREQIAQLLERWLSTGVSEHGIGANSAADMVAAKSSTPINSSA